ncbi:MAG: xanthine dehydrogenase family protein molybdopterin-binding subunit [Thermoplasmata archaeon]|nr:xanthine dehydrogenase family protein molybdopterin-binding subunit [Thermoplasmata archaeon]
MIRSDSPRKVRGALEYGVDLDAPGALHAVLIRSPVAHGRLRTLDLERVRSSPGVVAAIGAAELAELLPSRRGDPSRPAFPSEELRYRGEPVAAVAARTLGEARAAALRARIEVDPLPIVAQIEDVFPEWPGSGEGESEHVNAHVLARQGDTERVFARADRVVRGKYRTAGIVQMPLEPHACLARVEEESWRVQSSTQSPFGVREDTSAILGLPEEQVVVEASWVGGGFGGKGAALLEPYALLLAAASHRPVKLQLSYAEEFELSRSTLPSTIWIESAMSGDAILGRRVRLLLDTGASLPGRDFATGYAIGFIAGPYRIGAVELEGYAVKTNKPPFGPHRAPFAPQCVFAGESHTDEIAREAGWDPLEFRERTAWRVGDETPLGQKVGPFGLEEGIARARAIRERWRKELPQGTGIGLAVGFWSTGTGAGGEVLVRLGPTELVIETVEAEIGSGSVIRGLVAVAEEISGLPREAIRIERTDTARGPYDSGVYGSRTLGALGHAVRVAVTKLLEELGRRLPGRGEVRLELLDGKCVASRGEARTGVESLFTDTERATSGMLARGRHYGRGGEILAERVITGGFFGYTDFTAAVHLAAVAVDAETGQVRVVRYAAIADAGHVVDAPTYRAQVEGGVAMGLGEALTEETLWSAEAELMNPGLLDYRVPTLLEIPPIEVEVIEGFPGAGPGGTKGGGEPPIIPVPAAVANAVADASGARVRELPLTPERVARALKLL